jgi:hypothetical protein
VAGEATYAGKPRLVTPAMMIGQPGGNSETHFPSLANAWAETKRRQHIPQSIRPEGFNLKQLHAFIA